MDKSDKLPLLTHPEQNDSKLKEKGVSLSAFLDTVRIRKDKTFTVRIRIIHERYPKYYSTKMNMTVKQFEQIATGKPRNKLKEQSIIIFAKLKKANNIIIDMDSFSFEVFDKLFLNKQSRSEGVYSSFRDHIAELKAKGQIGTASTYTTALNSFKNYKKGKLSFSEITIKWLNNYEFWMKSNQKSVTTISMNTRCLRRLYNIAIVENKAKRELYPFGNIESGLYQPPEANNTKRALTLSDIKKIYEYEPEQKSPEHFNRDLWLFSYLANGMNMADIFNLKYENIKGETLEFSRKKTNSKRKKQKPIVIQVTSDINRIIEMWGNEPKLKDNFIFNILSNGLTPEQEHAKINQGIKTCNKYMKRIAAKIDIDENISTYYARHSYATILMNKGVQIYDISKALGHSNLTTTENYLGSIEVKRLKHNANKLTEWE